jgi:4-diphosphocytidyl-2-C-methyl-D-erythritol kinase
MVAFPPCKINLGLRVTRKRQDGYHDIDTCFYPVPWTDVLEIIPGDEFTFSSSGLAMPDKEDNLCVKAFRLLQKDFALPPVKIHLHKIIPIGAGLGGGSSDAAYTLRLLNEIFHLSISPDVMQTYAIRLGSDCSFFLQDSPTLGSGRGDELRPANVILKDKFLVLVNPRIHISTQEAYAHVVPAQPALSVQHVLAQPAGRWKDELVNDFETSVFGRYPEVRKIKEKLYDLGAWYASMSGSGSTVFGIFDKAIDFPDQRFEGHTTWAGVLSR